MTNTHGGRALNVTVKLFASYREKVGSGELMLDLPQGATAGGLAAEITRRYPDLIADPGRLVVAVNQEYREHAYVLASGDEVALIPPVSGGAATSRPGRGEVLGDHDDLGH